MTADAVGGIWNYALALCAAPLAAQQLPITTRMLPNGDELSAIFSFR